MKSQERWKSAASLGLGLAVKPTRVIPIGQATAVVNALQAKINDLLVVPTDIVGKVTGTSDQDSDEKGEPNPTQEAKELLKSNKEEPQQEPEGKIKRVPPIRSRSSSRTRIHRTNSNRDVKQSKIRSRSRNSTNIPRTSSNRDVWQSKSRSRSASSTRILRTSSNRDVRQSKSRPRSPSSTRIPRTSSNRDMKQSKSRSSSPSSTRIPRANSNRDVKQSKSRSRPPSEKLRRAASERRIARSRKSRSSKNIFGKTSVDSAALESRSAHGVSCADQGDSETRVDTEMPKTPFRSSSDLVQRASSERNVYSGAVSIDYLPKALSSRNPPDGTNEDSREKEIGAKVVASANSKAKLLKSLSGKHVVQSSTELDPEKLVSTGTVAADPAPKNTLSKAKSYSEVRLQQEISPQALTNASWRKAESSLETRLNASWTATPKGAPIVKKLQKAKSDRSLSKGPPTQKLKKTSSSRNKVKLSSEVSPQKAINTGTENTASCSCKEKFEKSISARDVTGAPIVKKLQKAKSDRSLSKGRHTQKLKKTSSSRNKVKLSSEVSPQKAMNTGTENTASYSCKEKFKKSISARDVTKVSEAARGLSARSRTHRAASARCVTKKCCNEEEEKNGTQPVPITEPSQAKEGGHPPRNTRCPLPSRSPRPSRLAPKHVGVMQAQLLQLDSHLQEEEEKKEVITAIRAKYSALGSVATKSPNPESPPAPRARNLVAQISQSALTKKEPQTPAIEGPCLLLPQPAKSTDSDGNGSARRE